MKTYISLILILNCLFNFNTIVAQQNSVIASGGDYFNNNNGSLKWTLGEIITETFNNSNGSLRQGFNLTNVTVNVTEELININNEIYAYPNPANNFIKISTKNKGLQYQLYDISGHVLLQNKIKDRDFNIQIDNLLNGIYFIKITDNKTVVKIFKIEKI